MRPSKYVTVVEHQSIAMSAGPTGQGLTENEAAYLEGLNEKRPGFCSRSHRSLRLSHYCGVLNLGGRVLEIQPKVQEGVGDDVRRGVLIRLLREARDSTAFRHLPVGQRVSQGSLLEVFISAFLDATMALVRGGLQRRYLEHEEDQRVVRGRINERRQVTILFNRHDRIACRFDELTIDNIWNQLIKLGLRLVRPWIGAPELNRRWTELMAVFEDVTDLESGERALQRLVVDRQAARYRDVVSWVHLIVALTTPSLQIGTDHEAPGLLVDINELFQSAIANVIRRRARDRSDVWVEAQHTDQFLATVNGSPRRMFRLRPDLLIARSGRTVAVGDTKWKLIKTTTRGHLRPEEPDVYQINAYASAYDCSEFALIYPWHTVLADSLDTALELRRTDQARRVISVFCVDVTRDSFPLSRGTRETEFGRLLSAGVTDEQAAVADERSVV